MVTLKNIKINNGILTADYYPELCKSQEHGLIVFDVEKKEVITCKYAERDLKYGLNTFFHKSVAAIHRMLEQEKDMPEEYVYMWY